MTFTTTFLGTGTSQGIPVIGCQCETCLSDNPEDIRTRTSCLVHTADHHILIDIGPDFRQQMLREGFDGVDAIIVTHEHNDHIIGLDDIRPIYFRNRKIIDRYAMPRVVREIKTRFPYFFKDHDYPGVPKINLVEIIPGDVIRFGQQEVLTFPVKHGSLTILGLQIGGLTYITDAKLLDQHVIDTIKKTPILVLNALQHNTHHSHLTLKEAIDLAKTIEAEETYLVHMSHTMGPIEKNKQFLPQNVYFAHDGLVLRL